MNTRTKVNDSHEGGGDASSNYGKKRKGSLTCARYTTRDGKPDRVAILIHAACTAVGQETLFRGALPALTKLSINGNGVENSGIEPLAQALSRGAMPALRVVAGIPKDGMQLSEGRALLQLKHLRELSVRIDSAADDEARRRGIAVRPARGSREVSRLEQAIKGKQFQLERSRAQGLQGTPLGGTAALRFRLYGTNSGRTSLGCTSFCAVNSIDFEA